MTSRSTTRPKGSKAEKEIQASAVDKVQWIDDLFQNELFEIVTAVAKDKSDTDIHKAYVILFSLCNKQFKYQALKWNESRKTKEKGKDVFIEPVLMPNMFEQMFKPYTGTHYGDLMNKLREHGREQKPRIISL